MKIQLLFSLATASLAFAGPLDNQRTHVQRSPIIDTIQCIQSVIRENGVSLCTDAQPLCEALPKFESCVTKNLEGLVDSPSLSAALGAVNPCISEVVTDGTILPMAQPVIHKFVANTIGDMPKCLPF